MANGEKYNWPIIIGFMLVIEAVLGVVFVIFSSR